MVQGGVGYEPGESSQATGSQTVDPSEFVSQSAESGQSARAPESGEDDGDEPSEEDEDAGVGPM